MNLQGKKKLRYAIFRISDNLKEIIVDEERMGTAENMDMEEPGHFQEVIKNLPTNDGRYLFYDYPYQGSFGSSSKVILVMWVPSNITIKKKMLYASSKDGLKKSFPDCGGEFQADCADDLTDSDITQKLRKI